MKALKTNSSFSARCASPPSTRALPGAAAFAGAAGDCSPTAQQSPEHCAVSPPQARIAPKGRKCSIARSPKPRRGPGGSQPSPAAAQARTCLKLHSSPHAPGRLACTPARTCLSTRSARGGRTAAALFALQERCFPRDRRLSRDRPQDSPLAVTGQVGPSRDFRLSRAHVSFVRGVCLSRLLAGSGRINTMPKKARLWPVCFCLANPV